MTSDEYDEILKEQRKKMRKEIKEIFGDEVKL